MDDDNRPEDIMGFVIGVFIYNREEVRSLKRNGVSCHFNSCEIQIKK